MPKSLVAGGYCNAGHLLTAEDIYRSPQGWQQCRHCIRNNYDRKLERARDRLFPESKICSQCQMKLKATAFRKSVSSPDGLSASCSACLSLRQRAKKYEIAVDELKKLLQITACSICGRNDEALAVDHSHSNGRIRGMLCNRCNWGLGHFLDSPELLRKAAEYLV